MAININDKRENPEDNLFWKKVREAHDLVSTNAEQEISFTVGNREAEVFYQLADESHSDCIAIEIREFKPDPPTLVVP